MNSRRVHTLLLIAIGLLAALSLAAVYFGNKMLTQASVALVDKKLENRILDEQQTALNLVSKQADRYNELENISKSVVPRDKDQAKAVREIVALAGESAISLQSVTFPTSSLGSPSSSGSSTSNNNGSTSSGNAAKPPSGVTQVKPVNGISGVYQLDITVHSSPGQPVTFEQLTDFLSRLERNRRTAQVTSISITPASGSSNRLSFTLIISVYLKP